MKPRNDPALNLLTSQIHRCTGRCLVIADEHLGDAAALPVEPHLYYLSNRYDIAITLQQRGANSAFNDFDFSPFGDGSLDCVIYRISKEKALVNHIINGAGRTLTQGGKLVLIGHKQEGLVSYSKKAAICLGGSAQRGRRDKGYSATSIVRAEHGGQPLDDGDYARLRPAVTGPEGICFYSKPGIYGWQKIDHGSELLIESLGQQLRSEWSEHAPALLDLGCGYGFLSVMAARLTGANVTATDNNSAAIAACRRNFEEHGVCGQVIADDCGSGIRDNFDLVLCNPPFHLGFDTSKALTAKFLRQAAIHLKSGGEALFVVNQFIDIEQPATPLFSRIDELSRADGFKVLRLTL